MITVHKTGTTFPALAAQIQELKKLVQDLENIRNGQFPGKRTLVNAPTIDNWSVRYRNVPCLTGEISGHPEFGFVEHGITSNLWILAPHLNFARTMTRFYVLGRPAKPTPGNA